MKNTTKFVMAIAVAATLTSCSITLPYDVSAAPIGDKKGSSSTILLGAWQLNKNFGIAEAAKQGKITGGVAIVDRKMTNYVFFQKATLIVYGK
jgi:hypothetical protein